MNEQVVGVAEFVAILNETLSFAYPEVLVEGEVSSFKVNQGKWVFFDLKEGDTTMGCFMPKYLLKVEIEDGMKVRVAGTPKLTKWGKFSFTARSITLAGEGELRRAFELLKARLEKEGLFAPERKRPLPPYPRAIGLVTSAQSAAYSDFMKILAARWGGLTISVADIQVQGAAAPEQVVAAINYFNQRPQPVDVVVLIRGGGSLEDLQAFNTEAVARAVAASRTPIIVGVGHEVDVSLADFAADQRAATPTDAARLVVPDRVAVSQLLARDERRLTELMMRALLPPAETVRHFVAAAERFANVPRQRVDRLATVLEREVSHRLIRTGERVETLVRVLRGVDPAANLRRGYTIVRSSGKVVKSAHQVQVGQSLMVQLADGKLDTTVNDKTI